MKLNKILVKKNGNPVEVLILVSNDIVCDGRVKKEAKALIDQGAKVTILGQSLDPQKTNELLKGEFFETVVLQSQLGVKQPRLGKDDIPRFIRIPINLTITKAREYLYNLKRKDLKNTFRFINLDIDKLLLSRSFDVVQSNDVYTLEDGWKISNKINAAFVVDSYELFDGYFCAEGHKTEFQNVSDYLEEKYLPKVRHVFSVTPEVDKFLSNKYNLKNTSVLLNSPYLTKAEVTPVHEPVKILDQCFLRRAAGNAIILEAMPYLKGKATLTFQGRSHDRVYLDQLKRRAVELGVQDIVFFEGEYDARQAVRLANDFDIGVILHRPLNKSKDYALANRLFTYMMAGLAVVASDTSAHRGFENFSNFGVTVSLSSLGTRSDDIKDGEKLANVILNLIEDKDRLLGLKKASTKNSQKYAFNSQAEQYCKTIKKVFEENYKG